MVLPNEDRDAYDGLVAKLTAEFKPEGDYESALVERIADLWWRMNRAASIEMGLLHANGDGVSPDPRAEEHDGLIDSFLAAVDNPSTLDALGRYEARLKRAF